MRAGTDLPQRVLDVLELAVVVLSPDLRTVLHTNSTGRAILAGEAVPPMILDGASAYVMARRDLRKPPPPMRVELGERTLYLRVIAVSGDPPGEAVLLREEVTPDVELFKLLNARYGVSRREYQILTMLRRGKTNLQIAGETGLAIGTVARHMHNLLARFDAPNRTRLVNIVEGMLRNWM